MTEEEIKEPLIEEYGMEFDDSNKVKIETLTKKQAIKFLDFLDIEGERHFKEMAYASDMMVVEPDIAQIWKSAVENHLKDIAGIVVKRQRVKEMFKL